MRTGFAAGGQASFPFELRSTYELYGYPTNGLVGTALVVANAQYTLELADIQRGLVSVPLALGRLSVALRLQGAWTETLPADRLRHASLPWSGGLELISGCRGGLHLGPHRPARTLSRQPRLRG